MHNIQQQQNATKTQSEVDKETDTRLYGGIAAIGNNSKGEIQYLDLD